MSNPGTPSRAFTSQRASPFRRPESPLGRSPSTVRAPTPQGSPLKNSTPSRPADMRPTSVADRSSWMRPDTTAASPAPSPSKSPIPFSLSSHNEPKRDLPQPQTHNAPSRPQVVRSTTATSTKNNNDPLSSIPANHLHTMRESFSVLDRSNTGAVTPADVATALSDLGLDSSSQTLATYFPPGTSSLNLGSYLGMLTQDLTRLSRPDELAAAFSAFDDDDSGQIDVRELREALLGTATEEGEMMTDSEVDAALEGFIGRRVLKKGQTSGGLGSKKEVFRYGDFTTSIWGGTANSEQQSVAN